MSRHPRHNSGTEYKDTRDAKSGLTTSHGGLYDRNGPIPVPDAHESDTESAWALFEESVMLQDNPHPVKAPPQPKFEETKSDATGFEPTDFGSSGYDTTRAAPLKP